jgi:hypothetical protein
MTKRVYLVKVIVASEIGLDMVWACHWLAFNPLHAKELANKARKKDGNLARYPEAQVLAAISNASLENAVNYVSSTRMMAHNGP